MFRTCSGIARLLLFLILSLKGGLSHNLSSSNNIYSLSEFREISAAIRAVDAINAVVGRAIAVGYGADSR